MTTTAETINLPGRALVHITGEEAEKFLQAVITTDLDKLGGDEAKPGALLTPQSRVSKTACVSIFKPISPPIS